MNISIELNAYIITSVIFIFAFGLVIYLIFRPKLKRMIKHKRYVRQLNDYFILEKPSWYQSIYHLKYMPIRYIHVSAKRGIRDKNKTLEKSIVIRKLLRAGVDVIDILPTNYTYIANTHEAIVKRLEKLEDNGKIKILSIKKARFKIYARYAKYDIFGKADKPYWWDKYVVIFQKIS